MDELIKKIETVINRLLEYDPEIANEIAGYSGKIILVDIDGIQVQLAIKPTSAGLELFFNKDVEADVVIKGKPLSLLSLLTNKQGNSVFPNDLELKGDINLAQRFQNTLKRLDIDWEEILSEYVGDTVARRATLLFNDVKANLFNFKESFKQSSSDYLRFETEMLPDQLLVDEFINDVDQIRNEAELLKLRVERLVNQ